MKKNILIASNTLNIGGIEKSLINLLKNIDYKKYNVDLILEHAKGELIEFVPKEVNIIEYKPYNFKIKLLQKALNYIKQLRYKLLLNNTYDCSICYATYSYPANKLARMASKNSILYVHSDYTKLYNESELKEFYDTRYIDEFSKIVFVSNEIKNNLIKYYPSIVYKSKVINNIVDIEEIKIKSSEKIDEKFNKKDINLLFVGRLEEESKNISTQLKLINDLKKDIPNIKLFLIGDGPDKDKYIEYVKNNNLNSYVIFIGSKINPYPYMKKCDYLLLTSNYEGFPVIFNEAIVLKKEIISTIKISDDFMEIGKNFGFLISNNYKKTLEKIKDILMKKEKAKSELDINLINKSRIEKIEELINER